MRTEPPTLIFGSLYCIMSEFSFILTWSPFHTHINLSFDFSFGFTDVIWMYNDPFEESDIL